MKLTNRDYEKLKAFYQEETLLSFRPGKGLLAWLQDHFDIRVSNNLVKMDAATKTQIREFLEQENPELNIKAGLPDKADHMAMSKVMRDEKLGSIKPNENTVLVKSMTGQIEFVAGRSDLGTDISYRVPVHQIPLSAYDALLVVENLDVFDVLPNFPVPIAGQVLLVYRGHDKGTSKGLKKLLEQATNHCPVCWFPDLDPKGLELAFSDTAASQVLSVDIESHMSQIKPLSNPDKFLMQSQSVSHLRAAQVAAHPLVSYLLKNQLAVMQQHLLTHKLGLKVYECSLAHD